MKKKYWQLLFLVFLIVGTVLIIRQQQTTPYQKDNGFIFGTVYNITYQSDKNLKQEIEAELKKVDSALSMFNPQSVISKINQGATTIPQTEEGRMFEEVVGLALNISKETDGAFDITVAPLVNAWGFGFKSGEAPTPQQVDSLRRLTGYEKIAYNAKQHKIESKSRNAKARPATSNGNIAPHFQLDCSAIAKGYGSDVVARLLRKKGIKNYMVEIGGEVVTSGISEKRVPWRIGVTKPTDDTLSVSSELQTVLNVTDRAMATSGNYRNFYYKGGKKYAHTIDPKTGYPVQHNILSATVLAPNCATADAYATSFMVLGLDGAKRILEKHPELMAYLIYTDAKGNYATWHSPKLKMEE